jgi:hypothetical protein
VPAKQPSPTGDETVDGGTPSRQLDDRLVVTLGGEVASTSVISIGPLVPDQGARRLPTVNIIDRRAEAMEASPAADR